ncbi:MAG: metallophosphoesterase [Leptospiraceae bacterium]|nr:metallophosphoesterase [Leptospiraceae bacterium]
MIKFIHISDLHLPIKIPFFKLRGKMFTGYINYALRRRKKYKDEAIKALIQKIKFLPYDVLIISGDLTNVSHEIEYKEVYNIIEPLLNEKTFMIPGNHDRYMKSAIQPEDLFQKYFGKYTGNSITNINGGYFRVKKINDYHIVGWDSNEPTGIGDASGFVQEEIVDETLNYINKENKNYLLVCHHPIWNPSDKQESAYHKMRNREIILKKILKSPPLAYFHGHIHTNWIRKKSENIPFYILNSASSTRIAENGYYSGFHYGSISESSFEVTRYQYVDEAKDYLEANPVYFE